MQAYGEVFLYTPVPGVGLPCFGEEWQGHSLSEIVELQAAHTDGVHDRRVVDDSDADAECSSTQDYISVSSRPSVWLVRNGISKRESVCVTRVDPLRLRVIRLLYRRQQGFHHSGSPPCRDQLQ